MGEYYFSSIQFKKSDSNRKSKKYYQFVIDKQAAPDRTLLSRNFFEALQLLKIEGTSPPIDFKNNKPFLGNFFVNDDSLIEVTYHSVDEEKLIKLEFHLLEKRIRLSFFTWNEQQQDFLIRNNPYSHIINKQLTDQILQSFFIGNGKSYSFITIPKKDKL